MFSLFGFMLELTPIDTNVVPGELLVRCQNELKLYNQILYTME